MNYFKHLIVKLAFSFVKQPVIDYFNGSTWNDDDATVLKEFLECETGKKFQQILVNNSNKCCTSLVNGAKNVEEVKAEAKSWLVLSKMLRMLCVKKKLLSKQDLSKGELDDIFARIISNNSRVTSDAIYGRK
jgi:hypothetical protein